jgi:hypothetical protein
LLCSSSSILVPLLILQVILWLLEHEVLSNNVSSEYLTLMLNRIPVSKVEDYPHIRR